MKFSKYMTVGVLAASLSIPGIASANEGQFVKTLRDSSAALQTSNSTLAGQLNDLAGQVESKKDMSKEEKKARKKGPRTPEERAKWQEHVRILRDAAGALQTTRPELASKLNKKADWKEKKLQKQKY